MSTPPRIYLLSNGFQAEYEIAFANGLFALWPDMVLVASDNTLVDRALPGLPIENWRGSQKEGRSRLTKATNLLAYWGKVMGAMRRHRGAVFHFNGLFAFRHPLANLVEALATRLMCRHWWFSVHNIVPHDRDTPLRRRVNRWIYRWPDRLIVHTPRMKDELVREWGVRPERVLCIRHGIDRPIEADAASVAHARRTYGIEDAGRPVLLCFGNIAPYKGADLMLEALPMASCRGAVSVLVLGRMRDAAFFNQLCSLAGSMPPDTRVQVLDAYVADEDMPGVLGVAAVMVLPYRHIDQSGVLLTARAAGLSVIATPVGSIGEELLDGVDQLAAACTPNALAQAIDAWFSRQAASAGTRHRPSLNSLLWRHTLVPYIQAVQHYFKLDK